MSVAVQRNLRVPETYVIPKYRWASGRNLSAVAPSSLVRVVGLALPGHLNIIQSRLINDFQRRDSHQYLLDF